MSETRTCPPPTMAVGEKRSGFIVRRIEQIEEIRVTAYELEHEATGASVIHLHCHDRENLFAIGFRTPPSDSTGLPHILEHSVLAGSERYPLKDVFNELVRGTLQTFLNAFTYPDKTVYPAASQEKRDFFNLAAVYLDLVLKPRLLRETFLQEGHHLAFDEAGRLVRSGIVYNEMKGAYSSPETLMYKAVQENLYPDTPYAYDSGGDPEEIPRLTYERFREFHRLFYSPTNARIFLYGDIPTPEHLVFLAEALHGFDRIQVSSDLPLQRPWDSPRRVEGFYPADPAEKPAAKTTVTMAWLLADAIRQEDRILLSVIADLLIGSAASPLRKALIDSGLGEDLSPVSGLERDLRQPFFATGLRGTKKERAERIEALILETLERIVEEGFDRELVSGTMHQFEFHGREIVRGGYPYGIVLMGRLYHAWLHGGDPITELNFPRAIGEVRRRLGEDPLLFQQAVRKWFLENPHRLVSVMEPSPFLGKEREEREKEELSRLADSLTEDQRRCIKEDQERLARFQNEPDPPHAAACLPRLKVADLGREVEAIPTVRLEAAGVPVLSHDLFTNGIAYLDLAFDVSDVPDGLQPYLPLLGTLTCQMGAAGLSYDEMAKRIARWTGGLGASVSAGLTADGKGSWQKMLFSVKALYRNIDEATAIVRDILTQGDLSDAGRMRDLILERKNDLQAGVIPSGHLVAQMAAAAALNPSARRTEQWHGRTQLRLMASCAESFSKAHEELRGKLEELRRIVFASCRLTINVTAEGEGLGRILKAAEGLAATLPAGKPGMGDGEQPAAIRNIGIAIPSQVCYVTKVLPAPPYRDPLAASLFVLARELSNNFLYRRIRVQGGAYGGSCRYDPLSGLFVFLSYRDPHLEETLEVFSQAVQRILEEPIPAEDLQKACIGAIGALDRPLSPAGKGYTAMLREFAGVTDEDRRRFREEVLDATAESLSKAAAAYFPSALRQAAIGVCAPDDRLRKANESLVEKLTVEKLLGE